MADDPLEPLDAEPTGPQVPEWAADIEDPELVKQLEAAGFKTPADAVKAWASSRSEMDRLRHDKEATEAEFLSFMESIETQDPEPAQPAAAPNDGLTDWAAIVNENLDPNTGEFTTAGLVGMQRYAEYTSVQRDAALLDQVEQLKAEIAALKDQTQGQLAPVVSAYTAQAMNTVFSDMRDVYGGEFEILRGSVQEAITAKASRDPNWIPSLDDVKEEFQKAAGRKYEDELRSRSRVSAARSMDSGSASGAPRGGAKNLSAQDQMIAELEKQLSPGGL